MTVVVKQDQQKFSAADVLWAKKEFVDAMIAQALINQTEGFVDMIVDGQADMSRSGIQDTLRGVKDSTEDFLRDALADFERAVFQRLKQAEYGAAVTGLKFDLAGEVVDVEVDVTVGFQDANG